MALNQDKLNQKKTQMIEKVMEKPEIIRQILENIEYKEIVKPLVKADRQNNPKKHSYPQLSRKYGITYHQVRYLISGV